MEIKKISDTELEITNPIKTIIKKEELIKQKKAIEDLLKKFD